MHALRVTERELYFFRQVWQGNVFTLFGVPSLFLIALGVGLGDLISETATLDGLTYLEFITPGLVVGACTQLAAGAGLWPVMAGHRWVGFHRSMVTSPIGPHAVVSGYLLFIGCRAMAQAAFVLAVGTLLGGVSPGAGLSGLVALLAVPVAGVTAASFTAPLMAYTATCDSDRAFDPLMRVVITPLYLFSGVFFPITTLPDGLQWLMRVFPLWHGVELARAATSNHTLSAGAVVVSVLVIGAWLAGGWLVARHTFTRRLTP